MSLNPNRRTPLVITVLALCLSASLARAEVRVAKIFSDHMVLQRDRPAPIWGWTAPGEAVTVAFAGQTKRATADAQGRWRVTLDPLAANSTGRDLTVAAEGATPQRVTIQDVLVGEVWFTAGQSNMMMGLAGATGGADGLKRLEACPHSARRQSPGPGIAGAEPQLDLKQPVSWTRPHGGYSAVSGFFAEKLYRHLGGAVPVGMITAVAIVPAEAWVDAQSLTDSPALKHLLKSPLNMTSKWFNGIIAPLGPLALRGVLYYQGEYNGGRGAEFQVLFPALIQSWRTSLEQPNLPFLFVQLPGFIEHRAEQDRQLDMDAATLAALHQPTLSGVWTDMREAQLNVWRSVPHTGMAVTIDVGEPYDIHPKQKEPVAERLLLSARQVAYGENVEGSSPVPARVEVDDDRFRVTFEHVGGGLVAKGANARGLRHRRPGSRAAAGPGTHRGRPPGRGLASGGETSRAAALRLGRLSALLPVQLQRPARDAVRAQSSGPHPHCRCGPLRVPEPQFRASPGGQARDGRGLGAGQRRGADARAGQ